MIISIVAAMSENGVLGRDGALPWQLPDDLKRFKQRTSDHSIVMGRGTFESIGSKPLPNRRNFVVTRRQDYSADGAIVSPSVDHALGQCVAEEEVFIVGGGEIYRLALPRADRMYLTIVHAHIEGDTHMPDINFDDWSKISDEFHAADDRHRHAFSFRTYERTAATT